jgi:phosphohistidine phosphatase
MRTLLLLRHGQAVPEQEGTDRDRCLTPRGIRAAEVVGQLLRDDDLVPDHILSSNAVRARDTAHRVALAAQFRGVINELDELYLAEPAAYIAAVRRLSGDAQRVLVVGHNPSLEGLALILTGEPVALPTAGLVVCSLPIANFSELSSKLAGEMSRFVVPSELKC